MRKNEVHGRLGKLQPEASGVGQHMSESEQKMEIFWEQYPYCYTGEANTEVNPEIAGMIHNYNRKFFELRISQV